MENKKNNNWLLLAKGVSMGGDPELFFKDTNTGEIVGSEKIIPEKGLLLETSDSKIVRDGIQVELNPESETCRQIYQEVIGRCFYTIQQHIKEMPVELCFDQVIKVTKEELDSLSQASKSFGCMPSYNVYLPKSDNVSKITVDPAKYLYRGGGGHIHLGSQYSDSMSVLDSLKDYDKIVRVLDILVGNFCVMIDRHPLNAERRKNYGRAGEYRKPVYGVEYRTLSNFWLRHTEIMSLVYGLSRIAVYIVKGQTINNKKRDFYTELTSLVNEKDIIKAINLNDFDLAKSNWDKIKGYLTTIIYNETRLNTYTKKNELQLEYYGCNISPQTIPLIDHFISKGLDYWFPNDSKEILNHWIKNKDNFARGWERFLVDEVRKDYNKDNPNNKIKLNFDD